MKKSFVFHMITWVLLVLFAASCKRVTLELKAYPSNTPQGAQIFVAGTFNSWNPGDPRYQMKFDPERNTYYLELPSGFGQIEYKFTRGDWTTVETDSCGGETVNHYLAYDETDLETVSVSGWNDLDPLNCSRLTLIIDSLPVSTPGNSEIYLAGNNSSWETPVEHLRFSRNPKGKFVLTVPKTGDRLEFKITRGSWETVETDEYNVDIAPRVVSFGEKDTVHISIRNWMDIPLNDTRVKTIVIDQLPPGTPAGAAFYLTGTFNDWNPIDKNYQFKNMPGGKRYINIRIHRNKPEAFKITRGGWQKVETRQNFEDVINRYLTAAGPDTIRIRIENWADLSSRPRSQDQIVASIQQAVSELPKLTPPSQDLVPHNVIVNPGEDGFDRSRKVFFIIDKLPFYHRREDRVFLSGDFNGWEARNTYFEFRDLPNGKKFLLLRLTDNKPHEYKLTRGDWGAEEASASMRIPPNRSFGGGVDNDTIHIRIDNWLDYTPSRRIIVCIEQLPENTPENESIYMTGDFNNWQVKDDRYRFRSMPDGRKVLEIADFNSKTFTEYKITRGDWNREFGGKRGRYMDNQPFRNRIINDTLKVRIESWRDLPR